MRAIAVDDELAMLSELLNAVKASKEIQSVQGFRTYAEAVDYVSNHEIDIAFLDIHIRGKSGMDLANYIRQIQPDCLIIFCTGYDEYAIDAFKMHANGYLLKPITPEAVQKEIDHVIGKGKEQKLLEVRCFGHFEVFAKGKPLVFKRSKTKEMFAYLIDRKGSSVSSKQLCAILWEEKLDDAKNTNYLWQLLGDLRTTLSAVGAENVFLKTGKNYSIVPALIDCDYFNYCDTGKPEFYGEYMSQYSWAEETCGLL